jgi:hypothetical protein
VPAVVIGLDRQSEADAEDEQREQPGQQALVREDRSEREQPLGALVEMSPADALRPFSSPERPGSTATMRRPAWRSIAA